MNENFPAFGDAEFDGLIRKAGYVHTLNHAELAKAMNAVFRVQLLDMRTFDKVKDVFAHLRVHDPFSQKMLTELLALTYGQYMLRRMAAMANATGQQVSYRIDHIPKNTPHNRRPGQTMTPKFLTIHSTGNPTSSAKDERSWLTNKTNDRVASFHIVVDANEAIECIPLNEIAWHAGDGNGNGNMRSISLEICESGDRAKTLDNAISVAASILKRQSLAASDLRRHHDWASKICPRILIDANFRARPTQTWDWFRAEVAKHA
jgi:N-acetylmuramoyl-L-alanine amidase